MVVNGAIEWTMSRDEGHFFLSLGRSLERIDMTARLLDVRHDLVWPDTGAGRSAALGRGAVAVPAHGRGTDRRPGPRVPRARPGLPALDAPPRAARPRRPSAVCSASAASTTASCVREVGLMRSRLEFAGGATDPDVVDQLVPRHPDLGASRRRPPWPTPTSARPARSCGATDVAGRRLRITHRTGYRYIAPVRRVVQRGAHDPARRRRPDAALAPAAGLAAGLGAGLRRLLGRTGAVLRRARGARRARDRRDEPRRRAAAGTPPRAGVGLERPRRARGHRPLGRVPRADRARRRRHASTESRAGIVEELRRLPTPARRRPRRHRRRRARRSGTTTAPPA